MTLILLPVVPVLSFLGDDMLPRGRKKRDWDCCDWQARGTAEEAWHGMDNTVCVQGGKGKKPRRTRDKSKEWAIGCFTLGMPSDSGLLVLKLPVQIN